MNAWVRTGPPRGLGVVEMRSVAHAQPPAASAPQGRSTLLELCLETLELRVPGTMARVTRIEQVALLIARQARFSDEQLFVSLIGARYHVLGGLGLPDELARACIEGRVEDASQLQQYTRIGGRYVHLAYPQLPDVVETIWYQFERPDGQGPYELVSELLPRTANVVALSRAVHTTLSARVARGESTSRWMQQLESLSGRTFLPDLLAALRPCSTAITRMYLPPTGAAPRNPARTRDANTPAKPRDAQVSPPAADGADAAAAGRMPAHNPRETLEKLQPLISREQIETVLRRRMELRPLAAAVQNLLAITASPECSIGDVAEALMADQVLSVRILKLANSSAYATGKPARTVRDAVTRIGIHEVRTLAMALDVIEQFEAPAAEYLDTRLLLEHSVAVGLVAAALGRVCPTSSRDDLFLMGALHDLGRLVLGEQLPDVYAEVCRIATESGVPLHLAERKLLHIDHAEITRRVLENWSFDADFCAAVASHHATAAQLRRLGRDRIASAAILALADRLAHAALLGCSGEPTVDPLDDLIGLLGVDPGCFRGIIHDVIRETRDLKIAMTARSTVGEWPDAAEALRQKVADGVRPLVVDLRPERNPLRLTIERIFGEALGNPTVAVLYAGPGVRPESLLAELTQQETEGELTAPLPAVFVLSDAGGDSSDAWPEDRPCAALHLPVRIDRLLKVCAELVTGRPASTAAV